MRFLILIVLLFLCSCGVTPTVSPNTGVPRYIVQEQQAPSVFDNFKNAPSWLKSRHGRKEDALWHGALDALKPFGIETKDTQTNTIVTSWYSSPLTPERRNKVTVHLKGQAVEADNIEASAITQVKKGEAWQTVKTDPQVIQTLKADILEKAKAYT